MDYRRLTPVAAVAVVLALVAVGTLPLINAAGSDNNVGRHAYKINIIGRPNDWKGSDTNGDSKTLFIGLKTNAQDVTCEDASGYSDAGDGTITDAVPANHQTIYFTGTTDGSFSVLDRDATDGSARIAIPADLDGYDVYIRVLGKPGGCLDANGYAKDTNDTGTYYYYTGHIDANRKTGAPQKTQIDEIFYVWIDTDGDGVLDTRTSVFDAMFDDYFWQVSNNGLRNMQLIFYSA
jgi:hypothetical protein